MTDSQKLDLIISGMEALDNRMNSIEAKVDSIEVRVDSLEAKIDSVEKNLRAEFKAELKAQIKKSEHIILSEVQRVHMILEKHIKNTSKHSAYIN